MSLCAKAFHQWLLIASDEDPERKHSFEEGGNGAAHNGISFAGMSGNHRAQGIISERNANSDTSDDAFLAIEQAGDSRSLRDNND